MREGVQRVTTVVATHTRVTHATKGEILVGNMHDDIVDTSTTRRRVANHTLSITLLSKDIERQRLLSAIYELDSLVYALDVYHRQHRAKYLLTHHSIFDRYIIQQRRLDKTLHGLYPATKPYITISEVAINTLKCCVGDHTYIVFA